MVPKRAVALATAALVLAGCGGDDRKADREAVKRVVRQFAQADGPQTCKLMTARALERVYGFRRPKRAYENCLRRADTFEAGEIEIDDVEMKGPDDALVKASTPDDSRRYRVGVDRIAGMWLVDSVSEESG